LACRERLDAAGQDSNPHGFVHVPMLVSESPSDEARMRFEGTAVGIFVAAGPDAGVLEFRINDGPCRKGRHR